jgi:hypothetical protein
MKQFINMASNPKQKSLQGYKMKEFINFKTSEFDANARQ